MTKDEIETLATFNAEVARGLIHTGMWQLKMMELQKRFIEEYQQI